MEYLYLTDMLKIIRKRRWYDVLGYETASSFRKAFGSLSELRNSVAHPGVAMIRRPNEAQKLCRNMQVIERALFRLRQHERCVA